MHRAQPRLQRTPAGNSRQGSWRWLLAGLCALILLLGLLWHNRHGRRAQESMAAQHASPKTIAVPIGTQPASDRRFLPNVTTPASPTAEEIVARKLAQFARSRRAFARALARRHNVQISGDVERFFDAVEAGNWNNIETAFKKINGSDSSAGQSDSRPPGVAQLWPAIIDAYGAAEQVHLWPAQQLLDYGNSVLGALGPGMVYVGGTDNGRWIPELLNDTSGGDRHIIITQNGLAAGDYQDYLRLQYDGQLSNLSDDESQRAFSNYVADAQKRLEHDQQFPNDPKQIRPGEDVRVVDGKVQVGGQVAVMAINELLLQNLIQKNPDLSFAIEESFPLKGTYEDALPLGPLMQLQAATDQNSFTADLAAQSLDYWRGTAAQILSNPDSATSDSVLRSYSHDAVAAANLLASHNFSSDAEAAYGLAAQLWPQNPESVNGLADLLASTGRASEARELLNNFARQYPDQLKALEQTRAATLLLWTAKPPGP
jgi:hypothetical protein